MHCEGLTEYPSYPQAKGVEFKPEGKKNAKVGNEEN